MTLPLPAYDGTPDTLQFILDRIATTFPLQAQDIADGSVTSDRLATGIVLQLNTTGTTRKVEFGTGAITFSSATNAASTFNHGLGTTPICVMAIPKNGGTLLVGGTCIVASVSSTQIQINGNFDSAQTGSMQFYWLAIG